MVDRASRFRLFWRQQWLDLFLTSIDAFVSFCHPLSLTGFADTSCFFRRGARFAHLLLRIVALSTRLLSSIINTVAEENSDVQSGAAFHLGLSFVRPFVHFAAPAYAATYVVDTTPNRLHQRRHWDNHPDQRPAKYHQHNLLPAQVPALHRCVMLPA